LPFISRRCTVDGMAKARNKQKVREEQARDRQESGSGAVDE
jgi:hypothetical protein